MKYKRLICAALLFVFLPFEVAAQQESSRTLADIRQELTIFNIEIQRLRRELSTTGAPRTQIVAQGSMLDRVTAIEAELQKMTGAIEELQFRIRNIVRDGTNRIGDLEFRLVELEGGDISQLDKTSTLGGVDEDAQNIPAVPPPPVVNTPSVLAFEQADYDKALQALQSQDFTRAIQLLSAFDHDYPNSPLSQAADLARGKALMGLGDTREAARVFLAAFAADQAGPNAPQALLHLGLALGDLGQTSEACQTLDEVILRFEASDSAGDAQQAYARMGCFQ